MGQVSMRAPVEEPLKGELGEAIGEQGILMFPTRRLGITIIWDNTIATAAE